MNESEYRTAIGSAKLMADVEPEMAEYWRGYRRGVMRGYHGDKFGTQEDHEMWMNCARCGHREDLQAGYRTGYSTGGT